MSSILNTGPYGIQVLTADGWKGTNVMPFTNLDEARESWNILCDSNAMERFYGARIVNKDGHALYSYEVAL